MERKFQIVNKNDMIICDNMILQVATNIYGFLCDVYHKDTFILKPIEPLVEKVEEETVEKPEADVVEE